MDYDIVIIGAGIHGCAIAQAAAAGGYKTLILEQADQAATATSSRSSKLIHGGLRYLESAQFRLVHECLVERQLLLDNAPELVHLTPFHIPIYKNTTRRPWQISIGLRLYSLLGGGPFKKIPRSQWDQLDGLNTTSLQAVYQYYDGQTDDVKLTNAVLASAQSLGAEIKFSSQFMNAESIESGIDISIQSGPISQRVTASTMVNAAGPWVNAVLDQTTPAPSQLEIDLVQGTHIILPPSVQKGMYYLEAPQDQRAVFVMPWKNQTLLGTTEKDFDGNPATVSPTQDEIEYLLEVYNHYFDTSFGTSDVIDSFAGARVLPKSNERSFNRSRDTRLHSDEKQCPRLLSVYGGKLTSHRRTAERVIKQLKPLLPARNAVADTRNLRLTVG